MNQPMLKARIQSINSDMVILNLEDGQSLSLSVSQIEGTPVVGQDVAVIVAALGSESASRQKLAQDLLNELLKG